MNHTKFSFKLGRNLKSIQWNSICWTEISFGSVLLNWSIYWRSYYFAKLDDKPNRIRYMWVSYGIARRLYGREKRMFFFRIIVHERKITTTITITSVANYDAELIIRLYLADVRVWFFEICVQYLMWSFRPVTNSKFSSNSRLEMMATHSIFLKQNISELNR